MISNLLMHREFTSSYMAKFVIEKNQMYVENANRAVKDGYITPDNMEPNPKNPIIASFFRNIGLADTLGSGTRKLFRYSKYYSGSNPEFKEGDIFRIIVPLDDEYSFDYNLEQKNIDKMSGNDDNGTNDTKVGTNGTKVGTNQDEDIILKLIRADERVTQKEIEQKTNISLRKIKRIMSKLQTDGKIVRVGSNRSGKWKVIE